MSICLLRFSHVMRLDKSFILFHFKVIANDVITSIVLQMRQNDIQSREDKNSLLLPMSSNCFQERNMIMPSDLQPPNRANSFPVYLTARNNARISFINFMYLLFIIHCTHYLSSHWLRAYG